MNAIIYTTNTGSTEHYAKLLAQKTGLPVYSLAEAKKRVFAGAEVIYLGWIMAGSVRAEKRTSLLAPMPSKLEPVSSAAATVKNLIRPRR